MKKIYLFCILLIMVSKGRAQFFALEFDSVNPYVTALPYPMDNNYRVVSYDYRFPAVPLYRTRIKVYDSTLQYVKTINLLKGITLVNDYPPLLYNKRLLWPANYNDTIEHARNSLVVLELDTNYNFVSLHYLSTHTSIAKPTGIVGYSTGFVVGEYFNGSTVSSSGYSTKVFKLDLTLQKRDSVLFLDELRLKTHMSKDNKIVGASDNLSSICTSTNQVTQKIVLDSNLTIIDCLDITTSSIYFCYDAAGNVIQRYGVIMNRKGIIFPISNTKTYVQGEIDNYSCPASSTEKAIISSIYAGNSRVNSIYNSTWQKNTNFPVYLAADCDYYGSNIIRVGVIGLNHNYTVDKILYKPYYAKLKTKMLVTKLDTSGNEIWSKQFGGEMNYFARSVVFTKDGGCVVAGTRYDSSANFSNGSFQNFLMRLDVNGEEITVNISENGISMKGKARCYPNPANNNIYFEVPFKENMSIEINNSNGELVLQKQNYTNLSPVDIGELGKGLYVYKIKTDSGIYTGKFISE
jgi:hypothetical protein